MATSQNPNTPQRRIPIGDRSRDDEQPAPRGPAAPDYDHTPGHPNVRGTLPMACQPSTPIVRATVDAGSRPTSIATRDESSNRPGAARQQVSTGPEPCDQVGRSTRRDQAGTGGRRAEHVAALGSTSVPRSDDDADTAALRRALRDPDLMARVGVVVGRWPTLDQEHQEILAALLNPGRSNR